MNENDVVSIGVKGATNQNNDSWAIWDNFKLIYLGFDPEYIRPALQQALNVEKTTSVSRDFKSGRTKMRVCPQVHSQTQRRQGPAREVK